MKSNHHIIKTLQRIAEDEAHTLRGRVAEEALSYGSADTDAIGFFTDLSKHGCISGMVSGLIYYADTGAFFDTYYDEIEYLREEYESDCGVPLVIKGDLKNTLAWFAFEETAYRLANELGIGG